MKRFNDLYLGSTVLTDDPAWGGLDGTHARRPAVYVGDNGDGTALVMRTSTSNARRGRRPGPNEYRLVPDGAGRGNSLKEFCDLIGDQRGLVSLPWGQILRPLGELDDAALDWVEDRLDELGV